MLVGKRIALFHNLPSGGAKRALYEWCKRLSENNHIDFYGYKNNHNYLDIAAFTKDKFIFQKPKNKIHLYYINYLIARAIDKKEYDFVFIHHDELMQSPALLLFLKTKKIYYCQEPSRRDEFPSDGIIGKIKDYIIIKLDKINAQSSNLILCNSTYSRRIINKKYNKIASISPLGVSNEFNIKKNSDINSYVKLLSVGRLHPSKGYDFLLNSLALLKVNFVLNIVSDHGNNLYKEHLINIAKKFNINIQFHHLSEIELKNFYSKCDVFCATQINEPFGLVILEAMASGLPVVAVNEGGFPDIIKNNINGVMVERNLEIFMESIQRIIDDNEIRNKISKNGFESSKTWSWQNSTNMLEINIANVL